MMFIHEASEASKELKQEIAETRKKLRQKGFKFNSDKENVQQK